MMHQQFSAKMNRIPTTDGALTHSIPNIIIRTVHTSCRCDMNVDVTNSQQIICSSWAVLNFASIAAKTELWRQIHVKFASHSQEVWNRISPDKRETYQSLVVFHFFSWWIVDRWWNGRSRLLDGWWNGRSWLGTRGRLRCNGWTVDIIVWVYCWWLSCFCFVTRKYQRR